MCDAIKGMNMLGRRVSSWIAGELSTTAGLIPRRFHTCHDARHLRLGLKRARAWIWDDSWMETRSVMVAVYYGELARMMSTGADGSGQNGKGNFVYLLNVVTGSRRGAGTTAQVYAKLYGTNGKSDHVALHGQFERNTSVQAQITAPKDLGRIQRIQIGHDNSGDLGVGWYLEHVEVIGPGKEEKYYFPVQRWLGESDIGSGSSPPWVKVRSAPARSKSRETDWNSMIAGNSLLRIQTGAAAYPHPDKVRDGIKAIVRSRIGHAGEDAYCITPVVRASDTNRDQSSRLLTSTSLYTVCSVADGVYSWREQGVDAGEYSRKLVQYIRYAAQQHVAEIEDGVRPLHTSIDDSAWSQQQEAKGLDPLDLLCLAEERLSKEKILGSCTACVGCIDGENGVLRIANLGDSGALVVRRGEVVFRTSELEHEFGFPFQLPIDSCRDAQVSQCQLFHEDVIIFASDGVFDNVSDDDIAALVRRCRPRYDGADVQALKHGETPSQLASKLASLAFQNSVSSALATPYAKAASEAFNMVYSGGKRDDITCVVAILTEIV